MHLESYFDILAPDVIRLAGHRIGIEDVIERYHAGMSAEQIAQEFPGLSLEHIYETFTYYLHNRAELDAYMTRVNAAYAERMREYDAQPESPIAQRVRAALALRQQHAA